MNMSVKKPLIRQGWLRVVLFCISFVLIAALITTLAAVALMAGKGMDFLKSIQEQMDGEYLWLKLLLELVSCLLSVWIFRKFFDRKSFFSLGWDIGDHLPEAITGLFLGPALLGIVALLLFLSGRAQWTDIIWDPSALAISLGYVVLFAISEEMVFRGYILNNLLESFPNRWIALAISSALFAILHIGGAEIKPLAFANLFLGGMLLGLNYTYTKNLWFSILFHLSWIFFEGPLLGFKVSGLKVASLLQVETKGDFLLTGGDYGLEGSILCTPVFLIGIIILAWAYEKKYSTQFQVSGPGLSQ